MADPSAPGWKWFPNVKDNWSLDVVTLLAVIGESSMQEHGQAITASVLCCLPRILPAPQALLKPSRPSRMPEVRATMTGVRSGTTLDTVGFFANIITPLDADVMPPYSFRVVHIEHSPEVIANAKSAATSTAPPPNASTGWWLRSLWRALRGQDEIVGPATSATQARPVALTSVRVAKRDDETSLRAVNGNQPKEGQDPIVPTSSEAVVQGKVKQNGQAAKPQRIPRQSLTQQLQVLLSAPTISTDARRATIPARLLSPIHILTVISFIISVSMIIAAVFWKDGNAILAVTLISFASTTVGYASFWKPILMERMQHTEAPDGDVLIRTRVGAFLLIKCTEEVARELYSGTEECDYYVGERAYRILMALGTAMLMISVVLLGNCTWNLQIFIGISYIVLNGAYWGLGMLPRDSFWDLSRYKWTDTTPEDAKKAHQVDPSFTKALWYAIRETKGVGWVERSGAAPVSSLWKKWLKEARAAAVADDKEWPAVERKNHIMVNEFDTSSPSGTE